MNAVSISIVISIIIMGQAENHTCFNCLSIMGEYKEGNKTVNVTMPCNKTFPNMRRCEEGQICGKYEISLVSTESNEQGTAIYSNCLNPVSTVENFQCAEGNRLFDDLLDLLKAQLPGNLVDPQMACELTFCYSDFCNSGQTAQVSLLVATLIFLSSLLF